MTDLNSAKQQADDDLTWLARNVHEWKGDDCKFIYAHHSPDAAYPRWLYGKDTVCQRNTFTRDQWLTRRAELQNKPSWSDAPEWAEWLAQDGATGYWWFYSHSPTPECGAWSASVSTDFAEYNLGEVLGDCRDTLERRPQAAKSEPNPEPSSGDWHKRGELPPVGTECEMFLDGGWWQVLVIGQSRHGHPVTQDLLGVISECINCKFRPLQTERERVASELVDVMLAVPVSERKTASESYMSMALAIYDHLYPENKS